MKKFTFFCLVLLIVFTLTCNVFATPPFPDHHTGAAVSISNCLTVLPKIAIRVTGAAVTGYAEEEIDKTQNIVSGAEVNLGTLAPVVNTEWQYRAKHYNVRVWSNQKWFAFLNRTQGDIPNCDSNIKVTYKKLPDRSTEPWNLSTAINSGAVTEIWSSANPTTGAGQDLGNYEVYVSFNWKAVPKTYNFDLIFGAYQE